MFKVNAGYITTSLNKAEAEALDKGNVHFDTTNATQLFSIQSILKTEKKALKDQFVKAPLVPKKFVISEINRLTTTSKKLEPLLSTPTSEAPQ